MKDNATLKKEQILHDIRKQLWRALICDLHSGLVLNNKEYFTEYAAQLKIPESKLRGILDAAFKDEVPDIVNNHIITTLVLAIHRDLLSNNKDYFKWYCSKTGLPENKLRQVFNYTYDGKISELVRLVRKAGLILTIDFEDLY